MRNTHLKVNPATAVSLMAGKPRGAAGVRALGDHAQLGEKCQRDISAAPSAQVLKTQTQGLELAQHDQIIMLLDPLRGFCLFLILFLMSGV